MSGMMVLCSGRGLIGGLAAVAAALDLLGFHLERRHPFRSSQPGAGGPRAGNS